MEDNEGIVEKNEEIKRREEQAKADEDYLSLCVQDVMALKTGRHFALWLLEGCGHLYENVFDSDPYLHAYNSGRKALVIELRKRIISDCAENYYTMLLEHKYKEEE